jgi:5-methylcytosine-specific restriction endonuclease McrA
MLRHGVLGSGRPDIDEVSEFEKFKVIPFVFGLMPEAAIRGRRYDLKVIPIIRSHLDELSINYDDELLHIVKNLCDQYFHTTPNTDHYTRRKFQISDVRATRFMYEKIMGRQNSRCAICGTHFSADNIETLDHIIPWRLIGDVHDGSNWQFLCSRCNTSKATNLSFIQMPEFLNWSYVNTETESSITNRIRYAVLCRDGRCRIPGCDKTPLNSDLEVVKLTRKSAYLYEFLEVRCKNHL